MCLQKPVELTRLYEDAPALFAGVRELFGVPDTHTLDLSVIDREWSDVEEVAVTAALTLYYLQSLRVLAKPDLRVRIRTIVNTGACLHSMLSSLAHECGEPSGAHRVWQVRDRIGVAAQAVVVADLQNGGGHTYMR